MCPHGGLVRVHHHFRNASSPLAWPEHKTFTNRQPRLELTIVCARIGHAAAKP
jgi:hypothetical protein